MNKVKSNTLTGWLRPPQNLATETLTIPTRHWMMRTIHRPQVQSTILKSGTSISTQMRSCRMTSGSLAGGGCITCCYSYSIIGAHSFLVIWESLPDVAIACLWLPINHGLFCLKWTGIFFGWHNNMQEAQSPWCWYRWGPSVPQISPSSRSDGTGCHYNHRWRAGAW